MAKGEKASQKTLQVYNYLHNILQRQCPEDGKQISDDQVLWVGGRSVQRDFMRKVFRMMKLFCIQMT